MHAYLYAHVRGWVDTYNTYVMETKYLKWEKQWMLMISIPQAHTICHHHILSPYGFHHATFFGHPLSARFLFLQRDRFVRRERLRAADCPHPKPKTLNPKPIISCYRLLYSSKITLYYIIPFTSVRALRLGVRSLHWSQKSTASRSSHWTLATCIYMYVYIYIYTHNTYIYIHT